jgi:hypothetical protein
MLDTIRQAARLFIFERFALFSALACLLILGAVSIPIPICTGRVGEKYTVLNHFVSELGDVGVSRGAMIFIGESIAAGALYIPLALELGFSIPNLWAKLRMLARIWTAVWLLLIGVFLMNK